MQSSFFDLWLYQIAYHIINDIVVGIDPDFFTVRNLITMFSYKRNTNQKYLPHASYLQSYMHWQKTQMEPNNWRSEGSEDVFPFQGVIFRFHVIRFVLCQPSSARVVLNGRYHRHQSDQTSWVQDLWHTMLVGDSLLHEAEVSSWSHLCKNNPSGNKISTTRKTSDALNISKEATCSSTLSDCTAMLLQILHVVSLVLSSRLHPCHHQNWTQPYTSQVYCAYHVYRSRYVCMYLMYTNHADKWISLSAPFLVSFGIQASHWPGHLKNRPWLERWPSTRWFGFEGCDLCPPTLAPETKQLHETIPIWIVELSSCCPRIQVTNSGEVNFPSPSWHVMWNLWLKKALKLEMTSMWCLCIKTCIGLIRHH